MASKNSGPAVHNHFPGGENMNLLFNTFESSNEEKWVGIRRKGFCSEMQGNVT